MSDINSLIASLKASESYLRNNKEELLDSLGKTLQDNIKENTPVETGNLRNSIKVEKHGDTVTVTSDCEYAPYIEYGRSTDKGFVRGNHMFKKGMNKSVPVIDMKIKSFMNNIPLFKK